MPTVITQGAASAKGYGFGASSAPPVYIEDVFSTYLYTGNSGTQTITNGIDLSGKGGLIWTKSRSDLRDNNILDTARGTSTFLVTNKTEAQNTPSGLNSFNTNGYTLNGSTADNNQSGWTYASWTFRKQPKFFDVVTYTGNGTAGRTISHNLGSVPGCIMIKRTDTTAAWAVYHRSLANTQYMVLNTTAAAATGAQYWNSTTPTSSVFSLGTSTDVNASGGTYVAYLFAHNAGGFGATGSDNVISCGSFDTDAFNTATINLSWEPQWVLVKNMVSADAWNLIDNTRGWVNRGANNSNNTCQLLIANSSSAEAGSGSGSTRLGRPLATGFSFFGEPFTNFIYIAIRRGPMKAPTDGTSVFGLSARTGTGANATVTGGQLADAILVKNRGSVVGSLIAARLTGSVTVDATATGYMVTSDTAAEAEAGSTILQALPWDVMDGVKVGTTSTITNASANTFINYMFRRAPGFFDVVCYTGTGTNLTVNHNLGVVPELMILKGRSSLRVWAVYSASILNTEYLRLDSSLAKATGADYWNSTTPTSSVFSVGTNVAVNTASATQIAYLFATVAGVSKVGSYTGTAALQTINCGFTGGARFVLIKRTDSTGDWYVWDSARGISSINDPYLLLNSTAAEVTGTNYVDTTSTGFQVTAAAPAAINANGGTFIFLAIA
jgi:hypothetical protein